MDIIKPKLRLDLSGYYFIGLVLLLLLGFWPSYFSKFFSGTNDFNFYFHFHAIMMAVWALILIVQPLLIRKKKLTIHRLIGKLSYVIMPTLLLSVLLILNSGLKGVPEQELTFMALLLPLRDLFLLITAFTIAVWYRRNINIHARAMIVTGIVFIEPALARFLVRVVFKGFGATGFIITCLLMCALLITLIIVERKQKQGRWIFPSLLAVYLIAYTLMISQIQFPVLDIFVRWFAKLPLT